MGRVGGRRVAERPHGEADGRSLSHSSLRGEPHPRHVEEILPVEGHSGRRKVRSSGLRPHNEGFRVIVHPGAHKGRRGGEGPLVKGRGGLGAPLLARAPEQRQEVCRLLRVEEQVVDGQDEAVRAHFDVEELCNAARVLRQPGVRKDDPRQAALESGVPAVVQVVPHARLLSHGVKARHRVCHLVLLQVASGLFCRDEERQAPVVLLFHHQGEIWRVREGPGRQFHHRVVRVRGSGLRQ
mmetsp:Transcript_14926/g.37817  ORF Transcript_14926/g.37817 Transcript_14926/m.37817 type:complete len:239 (+) Transcript_14926:1314-2030(+)